VALPKGNHWRSCINKLGFSKEQVIAFVISGNDLSMIETTGYFIAPRNATAEIQALANRIVPDVQRME
jgi:hydroxymethylpyrimidine pyrophosphatase-like HAD family hydrolase